MSFNFLLATTNIDKAWILRGLFKEILWESKYKYVTLQDIWSIIEPDEIGSITERAEQKALYYGSKIEEDLDFVIGSDDGIEIIGYYPATPASAEMTDLILKDSFPIGTTIIVHRSIAIFSKKTQEIFITSMKIPFTYNGNSDQIQRKKWTYPLSQVLIPEGHTSTFSQLTISEQQWFTYLHSQKEMTEIKAWIETI